MYRMKRQIYTAQFCDSFPPIMDGVGQVAKEYAEKLRARLGPTHIVVPQVPGYIDMESNIHRFPSLPIPGRKPYRFGVPWVSPGFAHRLTGLPLALVHAHSPFVAGYLALKVGRARRIPVVSSFHTKYLDDISRLFPKFDLPAQIVRHYLVDFYKKVDEVWVPNHGTGETLREYGYDGPFQVVANGTDIKVPGDLPASRARAEEFLGLRKDDQLLLYIGQIIYEKNLSFLLDALKALHDMGGIFRFVFVGEGYAREELEKKARKLGLRNVRFTGVIRDRPLIVNLMSRAALLTFPSLYDTSPLVLREAAAFGVPSILLQGATASEGIEDGVNGFLCARDKTAFGAQLKHALADPRLLAKAGAGARASFYRTWDEVADEVTGRYMAIIDRHGQRIATA